ncbi:MAG TPA: hypothetical protein PLD25_24570 [Chloroflexota bacterium]|nr:hypothetical protein [Chloroflexota bacterium]
MKQHLISLIFLWFVMGLVACTAQLESAYEPVVIVPTQDTATSVTLSSGVTQPPPALVHVTTQPTRAINTATAVSTETATATPTAVPPTAPARETPTNVPVTISPTIELSQTIAITATTPPSNTLPNAQTPTPGWYYYVSDPHGLMMQFPAHWQPALDHPYGFDGDDGFMRLYATDSQDNLLLNACQDIALAFGTAVPIEWLTVAGQEACLVTDDDGRVAALVVRFPEPRANIVPGVAYHFLVLQADPAHMPDFVQTLYFIPVTALTP